MSLWAVKWYDEHFSLLLWMMKMIVNCCLLSSIFSWQHSHCAIENDCFFWFIYAFYCWVPLFIYFFRCHWSCFSIKPSPIFFFKFSLFNAAILIALIFIKIHFFLLSQFFYPAVCLKDNWLYCTIHSGNKMKGKL